MACDIIQEIPLSQCVISELTKLLSLEGDTQIIKQTNRGKREKVFYFLVTKQTTEKWTSNEIKNNSPALDACFCLIVIQMSYPQCGYDDFCLRNVSGKTRHKNNWKWSEVNNYKLRFIFFVEFSHSWFYSWRFRDSQRTIVVKTLTIQWTKSSIFTRRQHHFNDFRQQTTITSVFRFHTKT